MPAYLLQHISMKIEDDLRKATDPREPEAEIARRNAERRLFGSTGTQSDRIRQEMQRYASMRDPVLRYVLITAPPQPTPSNLCMTSILYHYRAKMKHHVNPVMNAQLDRNRRIRTHRRNLSDPRFSTSLTDSLGELDVSTTRPPSANTEPHFEAAAHKYFHFF